MTILVVLNTLVLAMDHYGISDEMLKVLQTLNFIFTLLFVFEMALKLLAMGFTGYCRDRMNVFDGLVVILSIIELQFFSGSNSAISAFRTIRIARVARLFRHL